MLSKKVVLIIVSGLIFLNITKSCFGYNLTGKKISGMEEAITKTGDTVLVKIDPETQAVCGATGLKIDIRKRYGIEFSNFDKMSKNEISQFVKKFLKDQRAFIQVDLNEIVFREIKKDSFFRWKHSDSSCLIKRWEFVYSQIHKGVPVYNSKASFEVENDNIVIWVNVPRFINIEIPTTPSISKSQAVESAKRHLIENAVSLELPDSVRDYYDGFGFYWPEGVELSKLNALEEAKKRLRWFNKTSHPILEVSDTQKVYLNVSHPGGKTYLSIKTVKSVTPVTIYLKDSVKLFIFPEIKKDSSIRYSLRYLFSLTASSSGGWSYWVNARTGEVIFYSKEWQNADFAIQGTIKQAYRAQYEFNLNKSYAPADSVLVIVIGTDTEGSNFTDSDGDYSIQWTSTDESSQRWVGGSKTFNLSNSYCKIEDAKSTITEGYYFFPTDGGTDPWNYDWTTQETNVFYHTNSIRNFITSSPFNYSTMNYQCRVRMHKDRSCSWGDSIWIKEGTHAFTNDVIYHEYGHCIVHHLYGCPSNYIGIGPDGTQGDCMDEGFADYFACTMPINNHSWVGENVLDTMRNLDNIYTYGQLDLNKPHFSGQIIGGAVWDLRESDLGEDETNELFFYALRDGDKYWTPTGQAKDFLKFLKAMLWVDDNYNGDKNPSNGTPHDYLICHAFNNHYIKLDWYLPCPYNLTVSEKSESSLKLTWEKCPYEEDGFKIYRKIEGETNFTEVNGSPTTNTSFTDSLVADNLDKQCFYYVKAYKGSIFSGPSSTVSIVPKLNKPTNLQATSDSTTEIKVTWTDNSNFNTQFVMDWDDVITIEDDTTTSSDEDSHILDSLIPGMGYKIKIKASIGTDHYSEWTDFLYCETKSSKASLNVDADSTSYTGRILGWTYPPDMKFIEQEIQYVEDVGFENAPPESITSIIVGSDTRDDTITGLNPCNYYTFRVRAIDTLGDTCKWSDEMVGYTIPTTIGHHGKNIFEVPWMYDSLNTGPFNFRDLVGEAVNGSQGWNGINAGIKFVEIPSTNFTWRWGDLEYPTLWAKTEVTHLRLNGDTLGIGSIQTTLNRNIEGNDGTSLSWYNKNTATDSITSTQVDAYSVIMHEWGHWYVLKDATNIADTSFVTFPFHFAGKTKHELTVLDVNEARWMYSDSAAMMDATAPNYNFDWADNPGGQTITETYSDTKYFKWASIKKWDALWNQTNHLLWNIGNSLVVDRVSGSIADLTVKHKKELLCWAVVRPDLFIDALNIVLVHEDSLLPAAQDTTIPLEEAGMIVDSVGAQEILNLLGKIRNLPFTGLTGLRKDVNLAIQTFTPFLSAEKRMGEILDIAVTVTTLSGHITKDTTLTHSILMTGDVWIDPGVTLTIEPGVKIFIANQDDQTNGQNNTVPELEVYGTLIADSAQFRISNANGKQYWRIETFGQEATATFTDCFIGHEGNDMLFSAGIGTKSPQVNEERLVYTDNADKLELPRVFKFSQNRPNPFFKFTIIKYQLPTKSKVSLRIYDVTGRCVKTLIDREKDIGYYNIKWDGKELSTGIYFAKFKANDYKETKKLILIR